MTAKEKAKEMVDAYLPITNRICEAGRNSLSYAKQCALIEADEIFSIAVEVQDFTEVEAISTGYWYKVKEEINKLV